MKLGGNPSPLCRAGARRERSEARRFAPGLVHVSGIRQPVGLTFAACGPFWPWAATLPGIALPALAPGPARSGPDVRAPVPPGFGPRERSPVARDEHHEPAEEDRGEREPLEHVALVRTLGKRRERRGCRDPG